MQPLNLCKCGCGALVAKNYKKGHGRRGKKNSPEHNARIVAANKLRVYTPEMKEKMRLSRLGKSNPHKGVKHSEESKKKQSEAAKKCGFGKWMRGRKLPREQVEKMRQALIGHVCSLETRSKISEKNRGERNGMFGREVSAETRAKLSIAGKKAWANPDYKLHAYLKTPKHIEDCRKGALAAQRVFKDTSIERKVRGFLEHFQVPFEAHRLFDEIRHPYCCDFYIPQWLLIIECDGNYWHNYPKYRGIDKLRTLELEDKGYKMLRLWEHEINAMNYNTFIAIVKRRVGRMYKDYYVKEVA